MSRKKQAKSVSSKNEITKKATKAQSAKEYHKHITSLSASVTKFSLGLSDNLLTVKIVLMESVREVEKIMRERRR